MIHRTVLGEVNAQINTLASGREKKKRNKRNYMDQFVIVDGSNGKFLMVLMIFHVRKAFVYRYRPCHEILKSINKSKMNAKLLTLHLGLFLKP